MLKLALLAAAVALAASTATATNPTDAVAAPTVAVSADPACHPGQAAAFACALRATDGDTSAAPAELAGLALPAATAIDWAPLRPPAASVDFKDAATDTGSVLPATLDRDRSHGLVSALLALGALLVLLRRRPY